MAPGGVGERLQAEEHGDQHPWQRRGLELLPAGGRTGAEHLHPRL